MKNDIKGAFCLIARVMLTITPAFALHATDVCAQSIVAEYDPRSSFDEVAAAQQDAIEDFSAGINLVHEGQDAREKLNSAKALVKKAGGWLAAQIDPVSLQALFRQNAINMVRRNLRDARKYKALGLDYKLELGALRQAIEDAGGLDEVNRGAMFPQPPDATLPTLITREDLHELDPMFLVRKDGMPIHVIVGSSSNL